MSLLIRENGEVTTIPYLQFHETLTTSVYRLPLRVIPGLFMLVTKGHLFKSMSQIHPWSVEVGNINASRIIRYLRNRECVYNDIAVEGDVIIFDEDGDVTVIEWVTGIRIFLEERRRQTIPIENYFNSSL